MNYHNALLFVFIHVSTWQEKKLNKLEIIIEFALIVLIFFHILVLREYWVLMESRILLKLVLGGVRIVALSISSHKQTQLNRATCFLIL